MSAIESLGGRAGAPLPGGPESIRPPLWPLRPTEVPAKPRLQQPPLVLSDPALSCLFSVPWRSRRMLQVHVGITWVSPCPEGRHGYRPSMILANSIPVCMLSPRVLATPHCLSLGSWTLWAALEEAVARFQKWGWRNNWHHTSSSTACVFPFLLPSGPSPPASSRLKPLLS